MSPRHAVLHWTIGNVSVTCAMPSGTNTWGPIAIQHIWLNARFSD